MMAKIVATIRFSTGRFRNAIVNGIGYIKMLKWHLNNVPSLYSGGSRRYIYQNTEKSIAL